MNEIVYKVMNRAAFTEAKAKGSFDGSADDRRDGSRPCTGLPMDAFGRQ